MSNSEIRQKRAVAGIAGSLFLPKISGNPQQHLGLPGKEPPDLQRLSTEREAFAGSPLPTRRQRRIAARIPGRLLSPMTAQALTGLLGERVMKWTAAPNRVHAGPAQMDTELEISVLRKSRGRLSIVGLGKIRDVQHGRRRDHVFWGEGPNRRSCGGRPRSVQASGDHMCGDARVGD